MGIDRCKFFDECPMMKMLEENELTDEHHVSDVNGTYHFFRYHFCDDARRVNCRVYQVMYDREENLMHDK